MGYSRRLWITTNVDGKTGNGRGATEECTAQINWGSSANSMQAAKIEVYWPRGADKPKVSVTVAEESNPLPADHVGFCAFKEETTKTDNGPEEFACGAV